MENAVKRNPGAANAGPDSVFWLSDGQHFPSTGVDALGARAISPDMLATLPRASIVFASVASGTAGRDIWDIRSNLDDDSFLIAVVDGPLSAHWVARFIDTGADDVVAADDPDALLIAKARARRQVASRKRLCAERFEMQLQHEFLQTCIDQLPSPIFFKNRVGQYTGFNKAFERMIGMDAEKVLGHTAFELFPPTLAARYHDADQELMDQGGTQVYEGQVRFSDGEIRDVCFNKAVIRGPGGNVRGLAGAVLDISERKAYEEKLSVLAERDYLTGAFNRRKFFAVADDIQRKAQTKGFPVTFGILDIDHFKAVNDRFGHAAGDEILKNVTQCLMAEMPRPEWVARAGGEEFYAIFPHYSVDAARPLAEAIRNKLAAIRFDFGGTRVSITASIGIAELQGANDTISHALSRADVALYEAKRSGRNKTVAAA